MEQSGTQQPAGLAQYLRPLTGALHLSAEPMFIGDMSQEKGGCKSITHCSIHQQQKETDLKSGLGNSLDEDTVLL